MSIRYAEDYNKESYTKEEALQLVREAFIQGTVSMALLYQEGGEITLERLSAAVEAAPILKDMTTRWCNWCSGVIGEDETQVLIPADDEAEGDVRMHIRCAAEMEREEEEG